MKNRKRIIVLLIGLLGITSTIFAAKSVINIPPYQPFYLGGLENTIISMQSGLSDADLQSIISEDWKGELTYNNYSDGERVTIPAAMKISQQKEGIFLFEYIYPNEPSYNNKVKVRLKEGGKLLGDEKVISAEQIGDFFVVKTMKNGKDNGKKAQLFFTYSFNGNTLKMRKEYRTMGSDEIQFRNEYVFKK